MYHPLPQKYWKITQKWAEKNAAYKSGIHPGLDLGTPLKTPIYAPMKGTVTRKFDNIDDRGYCLHFLFYIGDQPWAMRAMHMQGPATLGAFYGGDIIGYTGNTGNSTGPHVHIDVWRDGIITIPGIYTAEGVKKYQVDPDDFFKYSLWL